MVRFTRPPGAISESEGASGFSFVDSSYNIWKRVALGAKVKKKIYGVVVLNGQGSRKLLPIVFCDNVSKFIFVWVIGFKKFRCENRYCFGIFFLGVENFFQLTIFLFLSPLRILFIFTRSARDFTN